MRKRHVDSGGRVVEMMFYRDYARFKPHLHNRVGLAAIEGTVSYHSRGRSYEVKRAPYPVF